MTSSVDVSHVVRDYNQTVGDQYKMTRDMRFNNVSLQLINVNWRDSVVSEELKGTVKTVRVTDSAGKNPNTQVCTTWTNKPNLVVSLVSGFMADNSYLKDSRLNTLINLEMSRRYELPPVSIDLRKERQEIEIEAPQQLCKNIQGAGSASIAATPQSYQGTFTADVLMSGDVIGRGGNRGNNNMQFNMTTMAQRAERSGALKPPFKFNRQEAKLTWQISGSVDLLLNDVILETR